MNRRRIRLPALTGLLLLGAAPLMAMKGDFTRGLPDRKRGASHAEHVLLGDQPGPAPLPQTREHILLGRQVGIPRVLEERDGSNTVTRQVIYAFGTPLWQLLADGSSQYLLEDARGNVVALTEGVGSPSAAAGDVLERVTYDPYGKPRFQDPANQDKTDPLGVPLGASELQNTLLFGGLWYDSATSLRSATSSYDFGGWYVAQTQYYNPNTGRHTTRMAPAGDSDRPIIVGRAALPEVNPYAVSAQPPVNTSGEGGNHEMGHALGSGSGNAMMAQGSGKRKHGPIYFHGVVPEESAVRKKPGRLKWSSLTASVPEPTPRAKEKFRREKVHLAFPPAPPTSVPQIGDEVIVGAMTPRSCVCVWMPYPCGNGVCQKLVCGGTCGGGGGGGGFANRATVEWVP